MPHNKKMCFMLESHFGTEASKPEIQSKGGCI